MADAELDRLRYPVGRFESVPLGTAEQRAQWIAEIEKTPEVVSGLVTGLSAAQMGTPYRDGGWTPAQIVHHMADSHLNAYVRTRWTLTEAHFTVKPYDQDLWATLPDARATDVTPSLQILRGLHARWVMLLRTLAPADFARELFHPERGPMTLDSLIQLYAWHGRHHAGHIAGLKDRQGW